MLHFFSSRSQDPEYEATAGWYIAPDEELAVPRISPRSRVQQWIHHHSTILRYVVLPLLLVFLVGVELRTSIGQAVVLSGWASTMTYEVQAGSSSRIRYPSHGPYNQRLGYERLPLMLDGLMDREYEIRRQARMSIPMALSMDLGLYPVYRHKDQAGLDILDHRGQTLFGVRYPGHAYSDPDSIPDMVWQSLLFIENRELLDESHRFKNPAVEWDRFALAAFERLITGGEGPGGSTLTTQLTKVRHSPNGRTDSPIEKLRQMASASLHAYQDGLSTGAERKRIVQEYLNQLPLAATAGHGEVNGLGDGLWAWYGREFPEVNDVLTPVPADSAISAEKMQRRAVAYRQVLSLLLSTRSPSTYLVRADGPQELARLTDRYLPLLADAGIISERLKTVALRTEVTVLSRPPSRPEASYVTRKAANSVRMELLRSLQLTNLPALNRLDLSAHTTYDRDVQEAVADVLNRLQDPEYIREQGLVGERLLQPDHISDVKYSFVLFERRPYANVLRVQADNVEGPFDVNRGSMLELGSTAKVRVLITYLELVERVYETYAGDGLEEARDLSVPEEDPITQWTIDYLLEHPSASRREVLEAAVDREYRGDPSERFFTGGGVHVFGNFSPETNRQMSIRSAVRQSANLAFVRMMRDVVNFHIVRLPGQAMSDLVNQTEKQREKYLTEFASYEGGVFLRRYFRAYQSEAPQGQLLDALGERHRGSSRRLAWAYRSVFPEARTGAFADYLRTYASDAARLSDAEIERLYRTSNPTGKSWQDLGYLAGIHPLELWLVAYLHTHPGASYGSVLEASVEVRQNVYQWLFQKRRAVQDRRIRTILEQEAFIQIQQMWSRLGYPFERLVPSLATALGSSADRPAALARLMGILLRDGQRFPDVQVDSLHFAKDTPFETKVARKIPEPTRVLSSDLSEVVRELLRDVVENGTAVRARGAITDAQGSALEIGGKTGTGDNRVYHLDARGQPTSTALNRTSTFVFYAGDRFFGTVVAYVEGQETDTYQFTSSLTTSILRVIGSRLTPLVDENGDEDGKVAGGITERRNGTTGSG